MGVMFQLLKLRLRFKMLKHTPYANEAHPFAIGVKPLNPKHWIEIDEQLPVYLREKRELIESKLGDVFSADFSSEVAQEEVLNLLVDHLLNAFPETYSKTGRSLSIKGVEYDVDLDDMSAPPLLNAALLIQEDLVIMRREADGWRFVAGSVCFPSSWVLREKIGKLMHEIHDPVPDYAKGTRNAGMIDRMFDNLQLEMPVERFNWSIYNDPSLYQSGQSGDHTLDNAEKGRQAFIRVERQTLRKLPKTGDILFTIRIHVDALTMLARREDKSDIAAKFIEAIEAMNAEQIAYKGLVENRDMLISQLREIAA